MASADTPPVWRCTFLRALAVSANVEWAARVAGVDKTSVYASKKRSAAFARSFERARDAGFAALADGKRPPADMLPDDGNWSIRRSRFGRPCVMRTGPGRWNDATETRFLALLTATANVAASAQAVGFSKVTISNRRQSDPGFAAACRAALKEGYARVELGLVARASASVERFDWIDEAGIEADPVEEMTTAEMLNLLKLHRASAVGGAPQRYDWRRQEVDIEAVRAEVLRKVAAAMGE